MTSKLDTVTTRAAPAVRFKFSGVDADQGIVTGYAASFHGVDSYGDIIESGAFKATLAEWDAEGDLPPLLWSHDTARPIGRILELREDTFGLLMPRRTQS